MDFPPHASGGIFSACSGTGRNRIAARRAVSLARCLPYTPSGVGLLSFLRKNTRRVPGGPVWRRQPCLDFGQRAKETYLPGKTDCRPPVKAGSIYYIVTLPRLSTARPISPGLRVPEETGLGLHYFWENSFSSDTVYHADHPTRVPQNILLISGFFPETYSLVTADGTLVEIPHL